MSALREVLSGEDPRRYPARPLLGVSAYIARSECVLLVRRARPPCVWSFPGGLVEIGETLSAAARREVMEETGLAVEIERLATVLDVIRPDDAGRIERHFVLAVFVAHAVGGELQAGDDAAEAEWVDRAIMTDRPLTPGTAELAEKLARGEVLL